MPITIFKASSILTMNPQRPRATHVAVGDGKVLGVGSLDELSGLGAHTLDLRFADKFLMPGFVEGHSHLLEGSLWRFVYVGFHDRTDPNGRLWPGARSLEAVVQRLCEHERQMADPGQALVAWGFDPIYFGTARCSRHDLDRVSKTRPVTVAHASLHILNVNSVALSLVDWLRPGIEHPGLPLGADGLPTGEVKGPEAMGLVGSRAGFDRSIMAGDEQGLRAFARLCVRKGVTTATDLASPLPESSIPMMLSVTGEDTFPTRIVPLLRLLTHPVPETVERAIALKARSSDRLRLGRIKVVADGSIQGFTARLKWPGYYNGKPNGLWNMDPDQLAELVMHYHKAGMHLHIHTNGDEASEVMLDAIEAAQEAHYRPDHRHTLQ
ncbi:MAG: amidohydrolase family protein, partial [Quisquiliibacterium sp.]